MTMLEAVQAVPHRDDCSVHERYDGDALRCDCDRDERIARGIEAIFDATNASDTPQREAWVLEAFVKASAL